MHDDFKEIIDAVYQAEVDVFYEEQITKSKVRDWLDWDANPNNQFDLTTLRKRIQSDPRSWKARVNPLAQSQALISQLIDLPISIG